ncbi:peptidoglycan-binding domain-containing protein [Actinocrispum wychmicini]|uniref:Peptidoglycan hydrolase-like protein with peptidoglycan-binding domain n=1 Tax=Actinocrispum wychmicini TaxID=1213861 RepID=A0A4R2JX00_9PSEU|nr:peptidoglycan-binding protein [Actinocrispum wychmicini]TCO65051.1 peptidoglycan hydrolase-like protein with peptidoglycan-binding domain [Actinocrispum wychmicini]
MKKMLVRAAIFAILTTGVGIASAGNAMACDGSARSDEFASGLPQVHYGQHGQHVLALQLALRHTGYTSLQGTGNYATNTLKAVRDFQRKHGIKDSGIVGSKTWHALVGAMPEYQTFGGQAPKYSITPGERNRDKVDTLGLIIQRIHPYSARTLPDGDVYGPTLQKMVKDFQRRAGIKASGIVGQKTWAAMMEAASASGGWGC